MIADIGLSSLPFIKFRKMNIILSGLSWRPLEEMFESKSCYLTFGQRFHASLSE